MKSKRDSPVSNEELAKGARKEIKETMIDRLEARKDEIAPRVRKIERD